jgi:hypothetical protein
MISGLAADRFSRRLRVWGASLFAEERRTLWNNWSGIRDFNFRTPIRTP